MLLSSDDDDHLVSATVDFSFGGKQIDRGIREVVWEEPLKRMYILYVCECVCVCVELLLYSNVIYTRAAPWQQQTIEITKIRGVVHFHYFWKARMETETMNSSLSMRKQMEHKRSSFNIWRRNATRCCMSSMSKCVATVLPSQIPTKQAFSIIFRRKSLYATIHDKFYMRKCLLLLLFFYVVVYVS